MKSLKFSYTPGDAIDAAIFQRLVRGFEARTHVQVELNAVETRAARETLTRFVVENCGADVSQVGSTWLRGLVDMDALRPFKAHEVERLGGKDAFLPMSWESTRLPDKAEQFAIPWLADVRLVLYRRDLLEKAGVDEENAFACAQCFRATLQKLRAAGVSLPWIVPQQHSWRSLHNVASWVWANDGNFMSSDGSRVAFAEPEALAAFKAYYALGEFIPPAFPALNQAQAERLFFEGQAAVTIGGPNVLSMSPEISAQIGLALPLRKPFVGGSHLVVSKTVCAEELALSFIRFLTSSETQQAFGLESLLPANREALINLAQLPGNSGEVARYALEAVVQGRSFRPLYLWDMVEARLVAAMARLWEKCCRVSGDELDLLVERDLTSLAHRLNMTLQSL
ncbi:MAG: extracellular solute-binding protein [Chloroflexota bacterium]